MLAADATGAEWACVCADTFERAGESFDVGLGEVLREVSFDSVSVVAPSELHCFGARVSEDDENRAAVVFGAVAADEPCLFHPVDDAGEAALAVQDPFGELVHADPFGRFLEVDEDVVPAHRDAHGVLELGVEHIDERKRALEEKAPAAQPFG